MINTKMNLIQALIVLSVFGCMKPDDDNLWSVSIEDTVRTDGFARDVYMYGDTAFIAAGQSGVQIWNLDSLGIINQFESYGVSDFEDVGRVYFDSLNSLLFIMDKSKIMFDEYDSTIFNVPSNIGDQNNEDFVVLSESGNAFSIYYVDRDESDGFIWSQFELSGYLDFSYYELKESDNIIPNAPFKGIARNEEYIAIAGDQMGVYLYTIEMIGSEPQFVSRIDTDGNTENVTFAKDGVFASCDNAGAYFIPITSFEGDGEKYQFGDNLTVNHIAVKNEIASLSLGSKGVALYDISDPTKPEEKGIFPVGYTYRTVFWKDKLLACTREGLQVMSISF